MIIGREEPHRTEVLRHEDEGHQRRVQPDLGIDEPEAQHDGNAREGERGEEVEDGAREHRRPERPHGRRAQALAHLEDRRGMRSRATEEPQRIEAAQGIQEMVGEPRLLLLASGGHLMGVAADHDHVEDDEGEGHERDHRRDRVEREEGDEEHHGDDRKVNGFAEREGEIGLNLLGPLDHQRRARSRACACGPVLIKGPSREQALEGLPPELARTGRRKALEHPIANSLKSTRAREASGEDGEQAGHTARVFPMPQANEHRADGPGLDHSRERTRK